MLYTLPAAVAGENPVFIGDGVTSLWASAKVGSLLRFRGSFILLVNAWVERNSVLLQRQYTTSFYILQI